MQCGVSIATYGIRVFPSYLIYMTVDKQRASICVEVYCIVVYTLRQIIM